MGINGFPDTPELMAAAKYWFELHRVAPAAMSHDQLEFDFPPPVFKENPMETAVQLYGLCPDVSDQRLEVATVGALAYDCGSLLPDTSGWIDERAGHAHGKPLPHPCHQQTAVGGEDDKSI